MADLMGRRADMFTRPTTGRVINLENGIANLILRVEFLDAGQDRLQKTVDKLEEDHPRKKPRVVAPDDDSQRPSQ